MPNTEEMANYVDSNMQAYAAEDKAKGKNWMVPPPPKPGEYIICNICGKVMLPENFSKDKIQRKHEFKWHVHWDCEQKMLAKLDMDTAGLLAERKKNNTNANAYQEKLRRLQNK